MADLTPLDRPSVPHQRLSSSAAQSGTYLRFSSANGRRIREEVDWQFAGNLHILRHGRLYDPQTCGLEHDFEVSGNETIVTIAKIECGHMSDILGHDSGGKPSAEPQPPETVAIPLHPRNGRRDHHEQRGNEPRKRRAEVR